MKAVVRVGGKQYIVAANESLLVDRLPDGTKELTLEPLMVFDDKDVSVGAPVVSGITLVSRSANLAKKPPQRNRDVSI